MTVTRPALHPLERFLGLFTEVHRGEATSALMLAVNIFLILTAYYMLKPVREALILSGAGGAEIKSYVAAGQAFLLLGAVPLYAKLASRYAWRALINRVTWFFAVCLVAFYALALAGAPIAIVFYRRLTFRRKFSSGAERLKSGYKSSVIPLCQCRCCH